jgi:t-SNARE complex subunit (syntaxin)
MSDVPWRIYHFPRRADAQQGKGTPDRLTEDAKTAGRAKRCVVVALVVVVVAFVVAVLVLLCRV